MKIFNSQRGGYQPFVFDGGYEGDLYGWYKSGQKGPRPEAPDQFGGPCGEIMLTEPEPCRLGMPVDREKP